MSRNQLYEGSRINGWIHFTLVWLIGIVLTTPVVFFVDKNFNDFHLILIPVLIGCFVCWKLSRKDLQFVLTERTRDFYSYLSCLVLFLVAMGINKGISYSTDKKTSVNQLTYDIVENNDFIEVHDLVLDTSKTGTYLREHIRHGKSTNLEVEGILAIQVKDLKNVYICKNVSSSCNYDFASKETINKTYKKVENALDEAKEDIPMHCHYLLRKIANKDNDDYQDDVIAALDAGADNSEGSKLVFLQIESFAGETPLWKNIKFCGIVLAAWMLIIGAVFRFTKEDKRKRRTDDRPLTKGERKTLFMISLAHWPILLIALICIVMYIVEIAMGYSEMSSDNEILYKLGALDSNEMVKDPQWWRLLTYGFLHASFDHIAGNVGMLLLVSFFMTFELEPEKQAGIFLLSCIVSGFAFIAFSQGTLVGASGGISGMMGAYLTLSLYSWLTTGDRQSGFIFVGILCVINIFYSLARSTSMICHLGGLACGFLIAIAIIVYREHHNNS